MDGWKCGWMNWCVDRWMNDFIDEYVICPSYRQTYRQTVRQTDQSGSQTDRETQHFQAAWWLQHLWQPVSPARLQPVANEMPLWCHLLIHARRGDPRSMNYSLPSLVIDDRSTGARSARWLEGSKCQIGLKSVFYLRGYESSRRFNRVSVRSRTWLSKCPLDGEDKQRVDILTQWVLLS